MNSSKDVDLGCYMSACESPHITLALPFWYPLWPPTQSEVEVGFPDPPTLEKCAKGIYLCSLLLSTQPNDWETVIEV